MIALPPKIDVDGPDGLFLIPFAKRQLARFKKLLPSGKRRWSLPTGEEVTIWWGLMQDRVRITAAKGFEFLVPEDNTVPNPRLFGLVFNEETQLYEVETSVTIGEDLIFPPATGSYFGHEDVGRVSTLGISDASRVSAFYYRDKGKNLVGPFEIARGPFSDQAPRQSPAKGRLLLSDGTLMSLSVPEETDRVWPSFDLSGFNNRANTAFPAPWAIVPFDFGLIVEGPSDGDQEFIIWTRYRQSNAFSQVKAHAIYMERYNITETLVPLDSAPDTGFTLVQTVSGEEDFADGGSVFRPAPIRFCVTPGPKGNANYGTISPSPVEGVDLEGGSFLFHAYNLGSPLPVNSPNMPISVELNLPQSSTTIFNDTTGPGVSYPFFPHARPIKVGEDVYWFVNTTSNKPEFVFDHTGDSPPFTEFYIHTGIYRVTYQRMVSFNGAAPQVSQQVRTYNDQTSTWDNITPVDIYIPIVGHLVNDQPMFLGLRVRQSFVPVAQMDQVGSLKYLPKTIFPAVFSPTLGVVHVYENVIGNVNDDQFSVEENWSRLQTMFFVGKYKNKSFYVFNKTFLVGGVSVCYGVPVDDPSAEPIEFPNARGGQIPAAIPFSPKQFPFS